MLIDCGQNSPDQTYFTLIQAIVPRPIAWVISDNGNGSYNLAPFSFFNAIASNPPLIMLSIGWKDETTRKDTWINIRDRKNFVVHIPSVEHLKEVVGSSATLPHGTSEIKELDLVLEPVSGHRLPKLKSAKVAFFCERYGIQEIGADQQGLILGEIKHIWIDDGIVNLTNGRLTIDPKALDPLARLGGNHYAGLGNILTLKRPD